MDLEVKGRKYIIGISIFILLLDVITSGILLFTLLQNANDSSFISTLIQGLFRLVFEAIILFFFYMGYDVAKWLLCASLIVVSGFSLLIAFMTLDLFCCILSILLLLIFSFILRSSAIKAFITLQQDNLLQKKKKVK